jgi:hypothetical protein
MALPKINTPIFELTLSSSGQPVQYRPFLVKEQKILLLALESGEPKSIMTAVKQIIRNCVVGDNVDVDKLPTFDLEYFFMRLRGKSIGEVVDLQLRHPTGFSSKDEECDNATQFKFNIMQVEVQKTIEHSDKIIIDENTGLGIKLKYPTADFAELDVENLSQLDIASKLLVASIDYIYDKEEVYKKEDSSEKELSEFIDNLSQEQFTSVMKFFETMPKLKHTINWKCTKCGCDDEVSLEGMSNFFAL